MENKYLKSRDLFETKDYSLKEKPIIIAYKIKTPQNIGNIIRLADNIGCEKLFFLDEEPYPKISKIKKTASSSLNSVNWEFCSPKEFKNIIPSDYNIYAIETANNSENIYNTLLSAKAAFVVGNEIHGIANDILRLCDKYVHIPMSGNNKSLNVSHALSVALFEWLRQQL
ncbi:MAG: TrmH family RNA methyltransferase [Bacteroidota bacterium]|nr:TrmH family RNA methyltransferase [Bacteroidota bacterium]